MDLPPHIDLGGPGEQATNVDIGGPSLAVYVGTGMQIYLLNLAGPLEHMHDAA